MKCQVLAPLGDRWAEAEPGPHPWEQACLVDAHQDPSHRNRGAGALGTFLGLARWGGRVWHSSRTSGSPPHLGDPAVSQSWISKARAHLWGSTGSGTGSWRPVGPQAPWLESLSHWSAGPGLQVAPRQGCLQRLSPSTTRFRICHRNGEKDPTWGRQKGS